jgi:hypothetical protein
MTQPEALRLADELDAAPYSSQCTNAAAAKLRRLHESNQELLAVMKEIMSWEENEQMTWGQTARAAIAKGEAK